MSDARASDQEREEAVARLRSAAAEGRLTVEDLAQRSELAYSATTRGELELVTADLPAPPPATAPQQSYRAVLSSAEHAGRWRLAARSRFLTVLGSTSLDLRQAVLPGPEVEIELKTVLGSVEVVLPEGAEVEVTGGGTLFERTLHLDGPPPAPGAPVVRIHVRGALGSATIRDRPSLGARIKEQILRQLEP